MDKYIGLLGAARSGTSLATKIFNTHENIQLLMESKLQCRNRHAIKHWTWHLPFLHKKIVKKRFKAKNEQIIWVGTKLGFPDVWGISEQTQVANYYEDAYFVLIVRDPYQNAISRLCREDYASEYNSSGRKILGYEGLTQIETYFTNWENSITNFYLLKEIGFKGSVLYYEDLCSDVEKTLTPIFTDMGLSFPKTGINIVGKKQLDSSGSFKENLKYPDSEVFLKYHDVSQFSEFFGNATPSKYLYDKYKKRSL